MKHVCVAMLSLAILTSGFVRSSDDKDPEPPGGAKEAVQAIKGRWVAVKQVAARREKRAPEGLIYNFDGEKLTRSGLRGNSDTVYKVKIDASKKPWRITLTPENGQLSEVGIFKIEKEGCDRRTGQYLPGRAGMGRMFRCDNKQVGWVNEYGSISHSGVAQPTPQEPSHNSLVLYSDD